MLRMRKVGCIGWLVRDVAHLVSTSASLGSKGKTQTGKVNMEELIGNTDGFADSGWVVSR